MSRQLLWDLQKQLRRADYMEHLKDSRWAVSWKLGRGLCGREEGQSRLREEHVQRPGWVGKPGCGEGHKDLSKWAGLAVGGSAKVWVSGQTWLWGGVQKPGWISWPAVGGLTAELQRSCEVNMEQEGREEWKPQNRGFVIHKEEFQKTVGAHKNYFQRELKMRIWNPNLTITDCDLCFETYMYNLCFKYLNF